MNAPKTDTETRQLTDEERTQMEEWLAAHPYGEQDENGIDLASLRRNRQLSPTERLQRLEQAANELLRLRTYARTTD